MEMARADVEFKRETNTYIYVHRMNTSFAAQGRHESFSAAGRSMSCFGKLPISSLLISLRCWPYGNSHVSNPYHWRQLDPERVVS